MTAITFISHPHLGQTRGSISYTFAIQVGASIYARLNE
jgi:hypothetical protein